MPEILIIVIISVLLILLIAYIVATYCTFNYIFKRAKREVPLLEVELEKTHYAPYVNIVRDYNGYFDNIESKRVTIQTFDKKKLVADYYDNNSDKTAILIHGYKATPLNNFAVLGYYLYTKGYNLLMVKQRAHGESEGKYITFGNLERKDCIEWIKFINKEYNPKSIILYGVSMGAATISMATELDMPSNVKALILDCGFTNALEEIKHECKYSFNFVPHPIIWGVRLFTRIFGKFKILEGNSERALAKNNVPALFIHGTTDKMVPYEMGKRNYEACKSSKEFIETKAGHAMSIYANKEEIEEKVGFFLEKHVK